MTKLNRRSVLSRLATVPLVSGPFFGLESASAQVGHAAGTRWLYVYIHGAYIVELQPSGVRLLPPRVLDGTGKFAHEYRAGYLPNGEGTPLDPVSPVALIGFPGAKSAPQIDKTTIPCFDNVPLVATSNVYCGAVLPFPDAIVPLRQIPQAGDKTAFFNLTELKDVKWLPLLLQFQYELQPGDRPALVGTGGSWKDDGRNPLILHFRAEPGMAANAYHDAVHEIAVILNKSLALNPCYEGTLACAKNGEEQSLIEIRNPSSICSPVQPCAKAVKAGATPFSRPANCVVLVVNNSGG